MRGGVLEEGEARKYGREETCKAVQIGEEKQAVSFKYHMKYLI